MRAQRDVVRHHAEWLGLLDVSGPFLGLPALLRVFPQGLDDFDARRAALLRDYYEQWLGTPSDRAIHRAFVVETLRLALDFDSPELLSGSAIPLPLQAPCGAGEILRPDFVLVPGGAASLLIQLHPPKQSLERDVPSHAGKSPAERMRILLRHTGTPLGLVTNGEAWMLVFAPPEGVVTYVTFTADLWFEEPITLRAFASLLGLRRFTGVPADETLVSLLRTCADDQHALTDQLGAQVRRAAEVLLQTLGRLDRDRHGKLLEDIPSSRIYAGVVTVMMRLIFLLSAEENDLLLRGEDLYDDNYAVSTLYDQLQAQADQYTETVTELRHDAWSRLLAIFRAVDSGMGHDRLHLPAYGGTLFKADAYPFLEGRAPGTAWADADPPLVDNRTVLHLLQALQRLEVALPGGGAESRRLSYRGLGVEDIGHIYEGLLDHTAARAEVPVLGLRGAKQRDLDLELTLLEALHADPNDPGALVTYLSNQTGRSPEALRRTLAEPLSADDERALERACESDPALVDRVRPFAGLLRSDSRGLPVVHPPGTLYMTLGTDRRASGTHYTRPELSGQVVEHTLAPLVHLGPAEGLPRDQWRLRSAREILQLKVCDPAMGSGAFLVQACRYLGARLVEAWDLAEQAAGGRPVVTPEGECATSDHRRDIIPRDPHLRGLFARRVIADRCLHGVDKNPLAVEMAKLSLWLDTMQRERAFSFLDHALRCGDSLLGLTEARQIEHLYINPSAIPEGQKLYGVLQPAIADLGHRTLARASALREQLEEFPVVDIHDSERKDALLRQADTALDAVRLIADLVVGTALATAARPRSRARAYMLLALRITDAFTEDTPTPEHVEQRAQALAELRDIAVLRLADSSGGEPRTPLHWLLAFPEVFAPRDSRPPGFDAFLGNPPFQGGQKITGALGTDYRDHLVLDLADDRRGSADLCAYFFLRAAKLLREPGQLGLVATNTIAQGDTREVALDALVASGLSIVRAVASMPWPGDASLEVALVWLRRGPWRGEVILDGKPVRAIGPALTVPGATTGTPHRLKANEDKSFIGSYILGMGFVLTPAEAKELIDRDPKNKDVLFPYINGEDLNSTVDQSGTRWVINFQDWPLNRETAPKDYEGPVAADYTDCLEIVEQKVKPERDQNKRAARRDRWWQYGERADGLYAALNDTVSALAISLVTNHLPVGRVPTGQVFAHKLVVFPSASPSLFSLLQSSIHYHWAWAKSSTMRTDINYSPTDCFETFPFPADLSSLEAIGAAYDTHRKQVMQASQRGLTKTYNRFHDPKEQDPAVVELRRLHVELDRAVVRAYGWDDLLTTLDHGFHETKQGVRFTVSEAARRELLDRLLALNHQRYAEEEAAGLHDKPEGPWYHNVERRPRKSRPSKPPPDAPASAAPSDAAEQPAPTTPRTRRSARPRSPEPTVPDAPLLERIAAAAPEPSSTVPLLEPIAPTTRQHRSARTPEPPTDTSLLQPNDPSTSPDTQPSTGRRAKPRSPEPPPSDTPQGIHSTSATAPPASRRKRAPSKPAPPEPTLFDRLAAPTTTLLDALRRAPRPLTLADLCQTTGLTEPDTLAALADLEAAGAVFHQGSGPTTRYRPQ